MARHRPLAARLCGTSDCSADLIFFLVCERLVYSWCAARPHAIGLCSSALQQHGGGTCGLCVELAVLLGALCSVFGIRIMAARGKRTVAVGISRGDWHEVLCTYVYASECSGVTCQHAFMVFMRCSLPCGKGLAESLPRSPWDRWLVS
jgi:hypothetical protein